MIPSCQDSITVNGTNYTSNLTRLYGYKGRFAQASYYFGYPSFNLQHLELFTRHAYLDTDHSGAGKAFFTDVN